jgi:hypothetical protein
MYILIVPFYKRKLRLLGCSIQAQKQTMFSEDQSAHWGSCSDSCISWNERSLPSTLPDAQVGPHQSLPLGPVCWAEGTGLETHALCQGWSW